MALFIGAGSQTEEAFDIRYSPFTRKQQDWPARLLEFNTNKSRAGKRIEYFHVRDGDCVMGR